MQETDLFLPLKRFFEELGYSVEGEVKDCDVLVKADQDFMAVELKKDFNFKLILQAVNRQKMFDLVYIAVPVQKVNLRSRSYLDKLHLLKRLGIGLLLVHTVTGEVSCEQQPLEAERMRVMSYARKKREAAIREFEQRVLKSNLGGSTRQPITTFYREQCYRIAHLLKSGAKSAAELAKQGVEHKRAATILRSNVYGWFEKESRGVYRLSPVGREMTEAEKDKIAALMGEEAEKDGDELESKPSPTQKRGS